MAETRPKTFALFCPEAVKGKCDTCVQDAEYAFWIMDALSDVDLQEPHHVACATCSNDILQPQGISLQVTNQTSVDTGEERTQQPQPKEPRSFGLFRK